jgi:hypothetical protein
MRRRGLGSIENPRAPEDINVTLPKGIVYLSDVIEQLIIRIEAVIEGGRVKNIIKVADGGHHHHPRYRQIAAVKFKVIKKLGLDRAATPLIRDNRRSPRCVKVSQVVPVVNCGNPNSVITKKGQSLIQVRKTVQIKNVIERRVYKTVLNRLQTSVHDLSIYNLRLHDRTVSEFCKELCKNYERRS